MTEKIAFLFLTRGEHHNIKLWEQFFENADKDSYKIAIHSKDPSTLKSNLWTNNSSLILRPIPTAWATISLVKATIYLLQMVMADTKITKFVLLSEFCIPTTNFKTIYDTLMSERGKSRINWSFGKNLDRYSIIKSYLTFPANSWAKQSQWMCLDRNHVNTLFIPAYSNRFGQYLNDFNYCPAPDEHFFINYFLHVIRINPNEFINHPITFVDWNTNSKHPKLFAFLSREVIDYSREHKILFARKFTPLEITIVDTNYLFEIKEEAKEEPEEPLTKEAQDVLDYFTNEPLNVKNKVKALSQHLITTIYNCLFNVISEPERLMNDVLEQIDTNEITQPEESSEEKQDEIETEAETAKEVDKLEELLKEETETDQEELETNEEEEEEEIQLAELEEILIDNSDEPEDPQNMM
jgi:hypothetical protein